jgi:hypothetical protein
MLQRLTRRRRMEKSMKAELRYGTAGGTLLSALPLLGQDVCETILLAAIGATISFLVTKLLQKWFKKRE